MSETTTDAASAGSFADLFGKSEHSIKEGEIALCCKQIRVMTPVVAAYSGEVRWLKEHKLEIANGDVSMPNCAPSGPAAKKGRR